MSSQYPEMRDTSEDRTFDEANALFHRAVGALGDLVQRLEAGDVDIASETKDVMRDIDRRMELVIKERQRFEERTRKATGAAAGGVALDFDAARDEIGRRLARLRASTGEGVISE
ncbi:MAG: hypothetical protein AAGF94_00265 [Pseudomonadota bacterium]